NPLPSWPAMIPVFRLTMLSATRLTPLLAGPLSSCQPTEPNIVPELVKLRVLEVSKGKLDEMNMLPELTKFTASICGAKSMVPELNQNASVARPQIGTRARANRAQNHMRLRMSQPTIRKENAFIQLKDL